MSKRLRNVAVLNNLRTLHCEGAFFVCVYFYESTLPFYYCFSLIRCYHHKRQCFINIYLSVFESGQYEYGIVIHL